MSAAAGAPSSIRIGLLWHSPNSGNLGVGALTLANIAIAREVAAGMGLVPRFVIIGFGDRGPSYIVERDVELFRVDTRALVDPRGLWAALRRVDCVLDIGGGDSFAEIYGPKRFLFLWLSKMMAITGRTPLVLSPQTIGPFTRSPYRQLAAAAMSRADAVVTRDRPSIEVLRALSPNANAVLAVDVAFVLPFKDRSGERGGGRPRVGVNVSGLLFNEAESGRNRFGLEVDYAALMRRFVGRLIERGDEVHLVAHANSTDDTWDDDGRIADRLAAEFPQAIRVPDFAGPSEAKSFISSLDFLVAGRMHACIGAFSAGVPVVPVAYSRKFSGLFGLLEYPWLVPVTGSSTDAALAYLEDCLDCRATLAADEARGMTKVGELLDAYRAELRAIFAKATAR